MGAAKKGDIDFLSNIVKPNIGIITNIGHSHLAGLDSLSGVLEVKSEFLAYGLQRQLELGIAIACNPKLLLLLE